ncbi:MAG: dipicolinate synthase subunit DpsA [Oscillospiraceae bacterium]|nr:dipicolinate synthase subunit DpsA [Oscillospiraceae bacterium]
MNNNIKIGVIGGDLRQLVAADELASDGYEVAVYGFDEYTGSFGMTTRCLSVEDTIRKTDFIIFPLPYSIDKIHLNTPLSQCEIHLKDIFEAIDKNQIILGGKFDSTAENFASEKNLNLIDYYKREDLEILNALPTAEGAINIAMQELATTLSGSKVLVMGYGRIGKILAHKLYGLHTAVYVSARKYEDFAWIEAFGYKSVKYDDINGYLGDFDVIFNTVPYLMLNGSRLKMIKSDAVIIDLASNPGGVDFNAAKNLGKNVIWALSLPGKYAPATAGKILAKIIKITINDINTNDINKKQDLFSDSERSV